MADNPASDLTKPVTDASSAGEDLRVYVPKNEGWEARIKPSAVKEYCYFQAPGEDHFHLLMIGELFLQKGHEKVCLNCARRLGIVTTERLHWQHPTHKQRSMPY